MNGIPSTARVQHALATATVDLGIIESNVRFLKSLPDAERELMAIVKADAFGHGMIPISHAMLRAGADWLGVAHLSEAIELREAGITAPIFAWLATLDTDYRPGIEANVDLSISSRLDAVRIAEAASSVGMTAKVHLKIDTGLHRAGSPVELWPQLLAEISSADWAKSLHVAGIWSHLSDPGEADGKANGIQYQAFAAAVAVAASFGIKPEYLHLSSSASVGRFGKASPGTAQLNLSRAGAGLYGIDDRGVGVKPAMTLESRIMQFRRVPAGSAVSYGGDWVSDRATNLALVPLGYADGIPRCIKGASVFCRGQRLPIVGRIAMDQFVVDAGDLQLEVGDQVILFGTGELGEPTALEWAQWAGTIEHEIYTGLGPRVARRYLNDKN